MTVETFLHGLGGIGTPHIKFRPGAPYTCLFGLTERHRGGEWGWPGIHIGVDRGPYGSGDPPIGIWNPLHADRTSFEDWDRKIYGTLIRLHHEVGFEVCIAHCNAMDVKPLSDLLEGRSLAPGTYLGEVGANGVGYGADARHTHTELRSDGRECGVLEDLLAMRYGPSANSPLSEQGVIDVYHESEFTKGWKPERCLEDFEQLSHDWGILFLNDFKMVRRKAGAVLTYYSSRKTLLF